MNAVRMHVVVPRDRQLSISLPEDFPPGDAEIIVLGENGPRRSDGARALLDLADAWRAEHPERRTREEVDLYLQAERATWAGGE